MARDILQNNLETIGAMISAAGTKEQIQLLYSLKDNMQILFDTQDADDMEKFTETLQDTICILDNSEFNLEFIKTEVRTIKLGLLEMTTSSLKSTVNKTRKILDENKVDSDEENEIAEPVETKSKEEVEEENKNTTNKTEDKNEENVAADEAVEEENKIKEEEEDTMAKTYEELKTKLKEAKEKAAKCNSSTLAKVGKVGFGIAVVAGAAYGGYYYAKNYSGRNTTIIVNGGDED